MESKWSGLRAIREQIQPGPSFREKEVARLAEDVNDIKQTLAGVPGTKHRQALELELTKAEGNLLNKRRRLAGRNPQMESWADPL
jgi:hypothetical protein